MMFRMNGLVCAVALCGSAMAVNGAAADNPPPCAARDGRRIVWQDEFDGTSVNTNKWRFRATMWASDCQYAEDASTVQLTNGCLRLHVWETGNTNKPFRLPRGLATHDTMGFKYGYLEMRARLPFRHGAWPSFWMQSTPALKTASWMSEVDILEVFSSTNKVVANLHKWGPKTEVCKSGHVMLKGGEGSGDRAYAFPNPATLNDEFHVYGFEWTPSEMSFFVDGRKYYSCPIDAAHEFAPEMPGMEGFQDFHSVIINNEIFTPGHGWCPEKSRLFLGTEKMPIVYDIDWVRLWQKSGEDLRVLTDALDDLLPAPRRVERRTGVLREYDLANVVVRRGVVPDAPAKTADEAYVLDIAPTGVVITAATPRGERWARVTLEQLLRLSGGDHVPCCRIVDWPTLKWRGYMNDCGRNYLELDGVKAIVDMMSRYKMNLFHWHLSDYHGWRLESKKYPQLQDDRAFARQIGKFYTQREFREIVRYAAERGVTVMPELDVPGHTLAFRRGMGIDTMNVPEVEKVLADIFEELCALAPADVMPFIHLGTDEVRVAPERCPGAWLDTWVNTVTSRDRAAVLWAPGEQTKGRGRIVDMVWYDNHVTNSTHAAFDAARMYNGSWSPFEVLTMSAFVKPCRWAIDDARKLGAITCTWHDDNVGEDTYRLFVDAMVFPTIMLFGDNYWRGRATDEPAFQRRLPPVGDPRFAFAADLERRAVAQRNRNLDDFRFPFPFLAQTAMRWRLTALDGKILVTDVPQGILKNVNALLPKERHQKGLVTAETWIKSPKRQAVGAWIDFTHFGCAYGRGRLPDYGQWRGVDEKVELNGRELPPPVWKRPGVKARTSRRKDQAVPYSDDLLETPFTDEGCVRRDPYPILLEKGWNHVRLTFHPGSGATFMPFIGPSERPREIPGLEFSSSPR